MEGWLNMSKALCFPDTGNLGVFIRIYLCCEHWLGRLQYAVDGIATTQQPIRSLVAGDT
jgi:hypothetical protein